MSDNTELIATARLRAEKYVNGSEAYMLNRLIAALEEAEAERDAALAAHSGGAGEMEFGVRVGTRTNPTRYATRGMAEYAAAYPVLGNADHPHAVVMRKAMYGPWVEATK